jgi:ketosteroid isomerase-like protein
MTDKATLLDANAAFYAAFLNGDIAALERLWADGDDISCIHPGWPAVVGRAAVIGSWGDILRSAGRPKITCHEPYAIVSCDGGRVLCVELMDTVPLAASNHFKRINGVWRLVHHQSSPIAQAVARAPRASSPSTGQIH